ncbi:hypothetical protein IMG5_191030 [Ichthyophthirius multifiliis]|uniref:Uncharacterized protein n=1 Tax=Ichthyophthirius multifiliis TaxID=5932 RepID=G0R4B8_ICHMU|nr:hypothetical protein IMG5_191030 [Ichthyophthirius multifiliis]EGR27685.1 hypothetical protein IMG5_191030 [Ichthyophthirius multifiliis]|eukprot:XP_004025137.1 hypothetical protein IMG5_191030 [Ichthyophthirius multifiliis]
MGIKKRLKIIQWKNFQKNTVKQKKKKMIFPKLYKKWKLIIIHKYKWKKINLKNINKKHKIFKKKQDNQKMNQTNTEAKLQKKESECLDLNKRIGQKYSIEDKQKDRDQNIFIKFMGRKPIYSNNQDDRLILLLNHFENQREKFEKENLILINEKEQLNQNLIEQSAISQKLFEEDRNKTQFFEKVQQELLNQINQLTQEKNNLIEINQKIIKTQEAFTYQYDQLSQKYIETKKNYDNQKIQIFNQVQNQENNINFQNSIGSSNFNKKDEKSFFVQKCINESEDIIKIEENDNTLKNVQEMNKNNSLKLKHFQQIIIQLCDIYQVENENQLIQCAQKTELVMQAIPKMENILQQITQVLFGEKKKVQSIDKIVPILQKQQQDLKLIDQFFNFKNILCTLLDLDEECTDKDIIEQIKIKKKNQIILQKIQSLFKVDNIEYLFEKLQNFNSQIVGMQRFIKIIKKLLELDEDMRQDACFTHILKLIENFKINDFDLVFNIQKKLNLTDHNQILQKIDLLIKNQQLQLI